MTNYCYLLKNPIQKPYFKTQLLNCSPVQCQVPAAAGDGASVNAVKSRDLAVGRSRARRAVGCR